MNLLRYATNPTPALSPQGYFFASFRARAGISPRRRLVGRVSCLRWAIELVGEGPHRKPTHPHQRQLILPGEQRERGRWPAAPYAASGPEGSLRAIELVGGDILFPVTDE